MEAYETINAKKRFKINLLVDIISVITFVSLVLLYKLDWSRRTIEIFALSTAFYFIVHFVISALLSKYEFIKKRNYYFLLNRYIQAWLLSTMICALVIYVLKPPMLSIMFVIVGSAVMFIFQYLLFSAFYSLKRAVIINEEEHHKHIETLKDVITKNEHKNHHNNDILQIHLPEHKRAVKTDPELEIIHGEEVRKFIQNYSYTKQNKRLLTCADNQYIIKMNPDDDNDQLVNIWNVNHVRYLNKFFETAYTKLRYGGIFIICCETIGMRQCRVYGKTTAKIPPVRFFSRCFDYLVHRVWPRIGGLNIIYFMIWKTPNKRLSYAEVLGRLYSCGFEYLDELEHNGKLWLAMQLNGKPVLSNNVTYGPLIKLNRIGKNKQIIKVFKLRTMHPYSEYLQEFVHKRQNLDESGKFKDDFRVSTVGKFLRKLWIDELPMFINLIKGEVKLFGVRPLSKHYFSLYPEEMQKLRTKYKPGLIPPFYYDMPKSFSDIVQSERKYLEKYDKNKILTDTKYIFVSFCNIIFRKARSK